MPRNGALLKTLLGILSALLLAGVTWGAREIVAQGKALTTVGAEHRAFSPRFGTMEKRLERMEDKMDRQDAKLDRLIERMPRRN